MHDIDRRDRRATAAVAVQFAVNGAFFASFTPRLPELRDGIGISTGAIGLMLTIAAATGLFASMAVRPVIARFGTRLVMLGGGVAIAAALLLVGIAPNWPLAAVGLAGMFFFDVFVDVAMNMQGSRLSARRARPIMSRLHGLWSLGSVAGGLIAAQLAEASVSLTAHLSVTAAVLVVVSTVLATQLLPTDEPVADDASDATERGPGPSMARFYVAGLSAVAIETAAISWAAFRLSDDLGSSAATAALAYVAVSGGMTIGRFSGDHLAHRWGADRLVRGSALLAMAALVLAAAVPVTPVIIAAFFLAGLGIAALAPRLYDLAARAGGGTASGLGVLTAGIRTAIIVAPASIAALASTATVGIAIAVVAVAAGAAFLVATRAGRPAP